MVGVWVGRDDNQSLGKVSGGTVPAQIWRSFMSSALSIDHSPGPPLPDSFTEQRRLAEKKDQSPLPPDWSDATKPLREIAKDLEEIFGH